MIVTEKEVNACKEKTKFIKVTSWTFLKRGSGCGVELLFAVWRLTGYGDLRTYVANYSLSLSLLSLSRGFTLGSASSNKLGVSNTLSLNGSCFWTQECLNFLFSNWVKGFLESELTRCGGKLGVNVSLIRYLIFWTHALAMNCTSWV